MIIVRKANNYAAGFQISLSFVVAQHNRDELLLQKFIEYFGCGILYRKKECFEYRVTKLSDFEEKILPLKRFGKMLLGDKLSNSGDILKPQIRIDGLKAMRENNFTVKILRILEKEMDNPGSKSIVLKSKSTFVKEQRVDGS